MTLIFQNTQLRLTSLLLCAALAGSLSVFSQGRTAIIADASLGRMELTDYAGYQLDPNNLSSDQLIKLKLPVSSDTHGKDLPAGSCKIKIGLGSRLMLEPGFDLRSAGMGSYFHWTASENGGQWQLTGELINSLPASLSTIEISLRLKVMEEGNSAITANFLITNHNSTTILSDENSANNASLVSYKVNKKLPVDPSLADGNLQLGVFPNPATNVKAVNISVQRGKLVGRYTINLYDFSGKLVRGTSVELSLVKSFRYEFGAIAAGQYLIVVKNANGTESTSLKFEKL